MQHDKEEDVTSASKNPRWWREDHTSAWTRVKEALRRDWEQTKHDFNKESGIDRGQGVTDTVKQMAGKQPLWPSVEPALRYGYGAGYNYQDEDFSLRENDLEKEWNEMYPGTQWPRDYVLRGWEWSRRKD